MTTYLDLKKQKQDTEEMFNTIFDSMSRIREAISTLAERQDAVLKRLSNLERDGDHVSKRLDIVIEAMNAHIDEDH